MLFLQGTREALAEVARMRETTSELVGAWGDALGLVLYVALPVASAIALRSWLPRPGAAQCGCLPAQQMQVKPMLRALLGLVGNSRVCGSFPHAPTVRAPQCAITVLERLYDRPRPALVAVGKALPVGAVFGSRVPIRAIQ